MIPPEIRKKETIVLHEYKLCKVWSKNDIRRELSVHFEIEKALLQILMKDYLSHPLFYDATYKYSFIIIRGICFYEKKGQWKAECKSFKLTFDQAFKIKNYIHGHLKWTPEMY
jgi:hypothetical protein